MAPSGDPWRTLELSPGASLDEVRRAYRRLAKANHPDAAGESALPRFLAIQAAYEQIAGPRRTRRPGSRPAGPAETEARPREPWRADPDRARASARADRRRPGARPTGRATGERTGPGEPGRGTSDRSPGGGSTSDAGSASAPGARRSRSGGGRRGRKTATPYSTSYDAADDEPFEPGWTGGTWYGASSGTYWTINPKEYADPRKHGPEYQARARRSQAGWILDDDAPPTPDGDGDDAAPDDAAPRAEPAASRSFERPRASRTSGQARAGGEQVPPRDRPPAPEAAASGGGFRGPLLPVARTPAGRAVVAFLGWPPLALFAGAAIDESTGCGRYAASCSEVSSPGTWILGAAILILLFAAPGVARWSAHGTIAMFVVGIPCAVILSAAGGTNVRDASAPLMLGVLAVAYLAGLAYGLLVPRLASSA